MMNIAQVWFLLKAFEKKLFGQCNALCKFKV